jgi:FkbM family methyltransferase
MAENRVIAFYQGNGYEKCHTYPLNSNSVIVELGAYEGVFAFEMFKRYGCFVYALDAVPQKKFEEKIGNNSKIVSIPYGLSPSNEESQIKLSICGDGTSAYLNGSNMYVGILKPFQTFCADFKVQEIDLININIEGGEYDLLDYLIKENFVSKMKFIQIQFHLMIENYQERYDKIIANLSVTHIRLFHFPWVWESWTRK